MCCRLSGLWSAVRYFDTMRERSLVSVSGMPFILLRPHYDNYSAMTGSMMHGRRPRMNSWLKCDAGSSMLIRALTLPGWTSRCHKQNLHCLQLQQLDSQGWYKYVRTAEVNQTSFQQGLRRRRGIVGGRRVRGRFHEFCIPMWSK